MNRMRDKERSNSNRRQQKSKRIKERNLFKTMKAAKVKGILKVAKQRSTSKNSINRLVHMLIYAYLCVDSVISQTSVRKRTCEKDEVRTQCSVRCLVLLLLSLPLNFIFSFLLFLLLLLAIFISIAPLFFFSLLLPVFRKRHLFLLLYRFLFFFFFVIIIVAATSKSSVGSLQSLPSLQAEEAAAPE